MEDGNQHNKYTVAVIKNAEVVGYMPHSISRMSWHFLKHGGEIKRKIASKMKKGNGLEAPCIFNYSGPLRVIHKVT